jgi:hypothetical protein
VWLSKSCASACRFHIQVVVDGPFDNVREKWPGLAHLSKLVSTGLPSTTIFTFFASRSGGLIVIEFLLKPNTVKETQPSYLKPLQKVSGLTLPYCNSCSADRATVANLHCSKQRIQWSEAPLNSLLGTYRLGLFKAPATRKSGQEERKETLHGVERQTLTPLSKPKINNCFY